MNEKATKKSLEGILSGRTSASYQERTAKIRPRFGPIDELDEHDDTETIPFLGIDCGKLVDRHALRGEIHRIEVDR